MTREEIQDLHALKMSSEIARLRAENAELREALRLAMERGRFQMRKEMFDWHFPDEDILNSTKPDPLYVAAPEMLEALSTLKRSIDFVKFEQGGDYIISDSDIKLIESAIQNSTKPA